MVGTRIFIANDMNTDIAAGVIASSLRGLPEFSGVAVWEPMSELKDADRAVLVLVTGADEIVPGNFTYRVSGEVQYRERYADADPDGLVLEVTVFAHAVASALSALVGRSALPDAAAAWVVLGTSSSPAIAGTADTFMVYKMIYELFIQF